MILDARVFRARHNWGLLPERAASRDEARSQVAYLRVSR